MPIGYTAFVKKSYPATFMLLTIVIGFQQVKDNFKRHIMPFLKGVTVRLFKVEKDNDEEMAERGQSMRRKEIVKRQV